MLKCEIQIEDWNENDQNALECSKQLEFEPHPKFLNRAQ